MARHTLKMRFREPLGDPRRRAAPPRRRLAQPNCRERKLQSVREPLGDPRRPGGVAPIFKGGERRVRSTRQRERKQQTSRVPLASRHASLAASHFAIADCERSESLDSVNPAIH